MGLWQNNSHFLMRQFTFLANKLTTCLNTNQRTKLGAAFNSLAISIYVGCR